MKLKRGNIYIFEWRDHFTSDDSVPEDCIMSSVGFFYKEIKNFYIFSRTIVDEDTPFHTLSVIKSQVLSIKQLYL